MSHLSSPTLQSLTLTSQSSPPAQLQSPCGSIGADSSSITSSATASANAITIPDHWRPEVEDCPQKTPNACQRSVASQLFGHTEVIVIRWPDK